MSEALYMNLFTSVQLSHVERRRRKVKRFIDRFGRFAVYGTAISAMAAQSLEPTLYASVASAVCLAFECLRN